MRLNSFKNLYGIVGFPLSHSYSKKIFNAKFESAGANDCYFETFPLADISEFKELITNRPNLRGLSVTIPYKEKVMQYLTDFDVPVKEIGAVNSIKITRHENNITLKGYNTDVYGFEFSLLKLTGNKKYKALVLGTGGASKAVQYVLRKNNIEFILVSRQITEKSIEYSEISSEIINTHKLIINTTPLGMQPNSDTFPDLPYEQITSQHLFFDLVYNPEETLFMKKGKEQGAMVINGLEMLYKQAEISWEIWNEKY